MLLSEPKHLSQDEFSAWKMHPMCIKVGDFQPQEHELLTKGWSFISVTPACPEMNLFDFTDKSRIWVWHCTEAEETVAFFWNSVIISREIGKTEYFKNNFISLQNVQKNQKLSTAKISSHLPDTRKQLFWITWIRKTCSRGYTLPGAVRKHWGWVPLWSWMNHSGPSWGQGYPFKACGPRLATVPRLLAVLSNFLYPWCHSESGHLHSLCFLCEKSRHRWTQWLCLMTHR